MPSFVVISRDRHPSAAAGAGGGRNRVPTSTARRTQALAPHLSPLALRNARLACKLWALHLLAGVSRITIWPALLTPDGERDPSSALLHGVAPSSSVLVLCSTPRKPTQKQLKQLWRALAASPVQQLRLGVADEFGDLIHNETFSEQLLSSLLAQPALLQRLRELSLAARWHGKSLCFPASSLTSLRSLKCSRDLLLSVAELQLLAQHCSQLQQLHVAVRTPGNKLRPQAVLDALAPLQQLRDLQLDNLPYVMDQMRIPIPDWPQLTRLVSRGDCDDELKLLPPGLCSRLQELQVGPLQLPQGATELSAVTKLELSSEQMHEGRSVPAMPQLLELVLEGDASYPQLLPVLQQLPSVTVRCQLAWFPLLLQLAQCLALALCRPAPFLAIMPAHTTQDLLRLHTHAPAALSSHTLTSGVPPTPRPWTSAGSTTMRSSRSCWARCWKRRARRRRRRRTMMELSPSMCWRRPSGATWSSSRSCCSSCPRRCLRCRA
jgi:hypothetical protein